MLWYCYGITRNVRLEDWPVTPCESVGFTLQPDGFFDRSPCVGPVTPELAKLQSATTTPVLVVESSAPVVDEEALKAKL